MGAFKDVRALAVLLVGGVSLTEAVTPRRATTSPRGHPEGEGLETGRSVDGTASEYKPSDRYRSYGTDPARVRSNVQVVYNELKNR
jgi:hypothetical protein